MNIINNESTYPDALTIVGIARNLTTVRERIAKASTRVGRAIGDVRLLPVSKTVETERLRLAYAAGVGNLARTRSRKRCRVTYPRILRWCVIGHLQSNKTKHVARFASEFQALDSLDVAEELDCRLQSEGRTLDVLV